MSSLIFKQIYPFQALPTLAQKHEFDTPQRAKMFCYPFSKAAKSGAYLYPPVDFSYHMTDDKLAIKITKSDQSILIKEFDKKVGAANFILLQDYAPQMSEQCLSKYRARIDDDIVPNHIDKSNFGFYEIMLNVVIEPSPFDFYIQIWLGGTLELIPESASSSANIWIKHPSNIASDCGFVTLDGIIDTQLWQGWLAVVIKPTQKNQWIEISTQQPLCQVLGVNEAIDSLENIKFDDVSDQDICKPLNWHIFEGDYGLKPGKYLKVLREKEREKLYSKK